ncbi:MAG: hypothetical protein GY868_19490, partial [Deltaproteobacteria bacterium]|nr:hypothetical protein [Deltaproteobacteria bacterium]
LGIVLDGEGDAEREQVEEDAVYEINLYFTQQAVDPELESLLGHEAGLYVYTFSGTCRHVTILSGEDSVVAGFEISGDIPGPVQHFLKREIPVV